jgi:hypothetical protein
MSDVVCKHGQLTRSCELCELHARLDAAEKEREDAKAVAFFAFVSGAEWWQYHTNGSTIFPVERGEAEHEAEERYPYAPHPLMIELEKERDELRGAYAMLLAERDGAVSIGTQLERERDELRTELDQVCYMLGLDRGMTTGVALKLDQRQAGEVRVQSELRIQLADAQMAVRVEADRGSAFAAQHAEARVILLDAPTGTSSRNAASLTQIGRGSNVPQKCLPACAG